MMWKNVCAGVLGAMMITGTAAAASDATEQAVIQPAGNAGVQPEKEKDAPAETKKTEEPLKVHINLAARSLALYKGAEKIRLYPIAPGTASSPTPVGYYKILEKDVNPTWTDPDSGISIPSGPDCPLGYRWMTLKGNYGIHGTNNPASVGSYASHGCVRMYEKDVEALFDLVEVGTPVEITYNRVVVEKTADDTVVYYIYPDGYGWQNLSAGDVHKWLAGYGVGNFVSDEDIAEKISASDGLPTYIGKVYHLYVNGSRMENNAVVQDGVTYLSAIDLANATKISLGWNEKTQTLVSTLGKAAGFNKRDTLYCKAEDAKTLFNLTGGLSSDKKFILTTAETTVPDEKQEKETAEKSVSAEEKGKTDKMQATGKDNKTKPVDSNAAGNLSEK